MPRREHVHRMMTEEDGAILVFVGIGLAVFLGLMALSLDFGQRAATQTELQSFADHVALAAAAELDGNSDSIARAQSAAANMISGTQTFATGSKTLAGSTDYTLTFYSALPANDTSPLTAVTTDPTKAGYVSVNVTPRDVPWSFWAAVHALTGAPEPTSTVGATAVAGFTQYACNVTPLMFCLPNANWKAEDHVGEMIDLRSGGQGSQWQPGNFGFIDPNASAADPNGPCGGLNATQTAHCEIGAYGFITKCFAQHGVNTSTGQSVGLYNSLFNTRFDLYSAYANGYANNPAYGAAPDVIKGIVPSAGTVPGCINNNSFTQSPNTVALPRDNCFGPYPQASPPGSAYVPPDPTQCDPTDPNSPARFGNGDWSQGRQIYVDANYGGVDPFPSATTRYQFYLDEIAAAGGASSSTPILASGKGETGRPECSSTQIPDPNRRVVVAAGVDCAANNFQGYTQNLPVKEFVKLFMTEPVGQDASSPPNQDVWVEVIGSAQAGSGGNGTADGLVHDFVQLVR